MELTGYLAVARRWWWTLLVATWVAALAGLLVASRITPTYEAQAQLLVGPINTDSDTLRASGLLVQTYAQLAISSGPLKSTAQELGVADPVKLGQAVRATANDNTRILTIRAQDSDPERAAQIANTLADELIHLTTGATTRPEGQLEVIGAAVVPTAPIAPQVSLIVLLAMVAGLIGGLILVIVVEYATDTVRDRADLARLSGTDVVATLGFDPRTPGVDPLPVAEATAPGSTNAIAMRLLASKVAFAETDRPTRTIMVAAVSDGDSALVATGIAAAVAGSGHRAVLIDGSPDADITTSLGLRDLPGLGEVVEREAGDPGADLAVGPAGVRVLPVGQRGPVELLAVDRARALLEGLLRDADVIVVDGGAMQHSAAALSWARAAQQTLLLVRRGTSRRDDLRLAIESLRFVNANVGGTVLVQRSGGRLFRPRRARSVAVATRAPGRPTDPDADPASGPVPAREHRIAGPSEVVDQAGPAASSPAIRTVSSTRTRRADQTAAGGPRHPGPDQARSTGRSTTWTPIDETKPVRKRPTRTTAED